MVANEDLVFALFFDGSIEIMKAEDISQVILKQEKKAIVKDDNIEISGMTVCNGQVWLGDKNGLVYVLNADTLLPGDEPTDLKTNNSFTVTTMASSLDGSTVAVGDSKGYITFFDTSSRA